MNWDELQQVDLPGGRWVLIVSVEHVTRFITIGTEAMAEVRGVLLDMDTRSIVWRGVGKGDYRAGILVSGLVDNGALEMAILQLSQSLPRKGDNPEDYNPEINRKLIRPAVTIPGVQPGMLQEDIERLHDKKGRVHSYEEGETWIYHENMAVGFAPGANLFYKPDLSVFHFDKTGVLRKYHVFGGEQR